MANQKRIPRVATIDPHTIAGGGPELLEMVRFSNKQWLMIKALAWPFKHRILSLVVIVILGTMIFESVNPLLILLNLMLATLITAVVLYTYTYFRYAYAPTLGRLTTAIIRRWKVHKRWPAAIQAAGFRTSRKLSKVKYTPNGIVGKFKCNQGHTSSDLAAGAEEIASVLEAHEVKVDTNLPYLATVSIIWGDPTERILFPEDLSDSQSGDDDKITFALDADHQPLELSVTTSVLIVGESESGKSNCLWAILNGLNEKDIPYKMWVADPAGGVELDALEYSPNTIRYSAKPSEIDSMLAEAYDAMEQRLTLMKGADRKYKRSKEFPLNIVLVDELLLLSRFDQTTAFGKILSSGRKAGFIVIGLSQLSQVDALGRVRDLFPQRICHATKSVEMTDAALGSGAEAAGANCSKIPKRTSGVGYFFSDATRLYTRFRTPLISDANTRVIAQGNLIQRTITDDPIRKKWRKRLGRRRTAVYQYFGEYQGEIGRLLYVGIAYDPKKRWHEHCTDTSQPWCPDDVDTSLTEITWFNSRPLAKSEESRLIREEHPVYNKQERVDYVDAA